MSRYSPTVVYGTWAYPAYPPYPYYPPGYGMAAATFGFMAGVAVGSSGCCWGNADWHGGDVDIDVNRNNNFTKNNYGGDRVNHYQKQGGQGGRQQWQHNAENRKGAAYRDNATAQKFNRGTSAHAARSREAFRGRSDQGRRRIGQDSQGSMEEPGLHQRSRWRSIQRHGPRRKQREGLQQPWKFQPSKHVRRWRIQWWFPWQRWVWRRFPWRGRRWTRRRWRRKEITMSIAIATIMKQLKEEGMKLPEIQVRQISALYAFSIAVAW